MRKGGRRREALAWCLALLLAACAGEPTSPEKSAGSRIDGDVARPSILLVTLDTTRADRLEDERGRAAAPNLADLAERGIRFSQGYSTVPTTLPSHTSMLTGLYPTDHGIRENGRRVAEELRLVQETLKGLGYATAAFVSGFPLDSRFGLARGFDHYDDDFGPDRVERSAAETTDLALAFLGTGTLFAASEKGACPLFLWVHYFDPHDPYEPPEPFASEFADEPYLGEIAYMDDQLGRLFDAFETRFGSGAWRIVVVGDHGEGLGDHGEALHGNLLYQGVMRVPLIVAGSGVEPERVDRAVSVRDLTPTLLGWAGGEANPGWLSSSEEPILAEALKPYLQYGWQPQFMAVRDGLKIIRSQDIEVYDVVDDPGETENLAGKVEIDPRLRQALSEYVDQALAEPPAGGDLSDESREKLASLGYIASSGQPVLREDAPNPKDMVHLYRDLDIGAGLFIRQEYEAAIPVFTRVLESDPNNLMVALRLAVAYSVIGQGAQAMRYFERAREIDPSSVDLRHYQAMHHLRLREWEQAEPLFESVLAATPDRLPALEGLAEIYTRQGRLDEAIALLERVVQIKESPGLELARLGELRMARGDTAGAIRAFERARDLLGDDFTYHLELGVLYLADRQLDPAAESLDRVNPRHPGYPMALFKRAQVSVLRNEPDREARVRAAWANADQATRPLIESERLFAGLDYR